MVYRVLRSAASLVVGLGAAFVLIVAVESLSAIVHPFPLGVDPTDIEACKAHVAKYPGWVLALVNGSWGFTAFVSSWLATRLGTGRHPAHGVAIGAILILAVTFNMYMLPYPVWFEVLNYVIFPIATFYGAKLGRGKPANDGPAHTGEHAGNGG